MNPLAIGVGLLALFFVGLVLLLARLRSGLREAQREHHIDTCPECKGRVERIEDAPRQRRTP